MTGQDFINQLRAEMVRCGRLDKEYAKENLVDDASAIFWSAKPHTMAEQSQAQEQDLVVAREETAKLDKPGDAA